MFHLARCLRCLGTTVILEQLNGELGETNKLVAVRRKTARKTINWRRDARNRTGQGQILGKSGKLPADT